MQEGGVGGGGGGGGGVGGRSAEQPLAQGPSMLLTLPHKLS